MWTRGRETSGLPPAAARWGPTLTKSKATGASSGQRPRRTPSRGQAAPDPPPQWPRGASPFTQLFSFHRQGDCPPLGEHAKVWDWLQVEDPEPSLLSDGSEPFCYNLEVGASVVISESVSCSVVFSSCVPLDCSPPGSSVHGILQARILEWVVIPFSRGSSWPRDRTPVSCIAGRFFTVWATREAWLNYTYVYFFMFFPWWFITEYWMQFSVLYRDLPCFSILHIPACIC